jgi:hypothetical protein
VMKPCAQWGQPIDIFGKPRPPSDTHISQLYRGPRPDLRDYEPWENADTRVLTDLLDVST